MKQQTLCVICGLAPTIRHKNGNYRLSCINPECRDAVMRVDHRRALVEGWGEVAPVYIPTDYFTRHNIDPGDGGRRLWSLRPDRQSYSGSSAAWAAGI